MQLESSDEEANNEAFADAVEPEAESPEQAAAFDTFEMYEDATQKEQLDEIRLRLPEGTNCKYYYALRLA